MLLWLTGRRSEAGISGDEYLKQGDKVLVAAFEGAGKLGKERRCQRNEISISWFMSTAINDIRFKSESRV